MLVTGGRIDAVGRRADLLRPAIREDRFPGCTIIAGLADAHFHPVGYTGALRRLVLKNATDFADLLDRVSAAERDLPAGETLIGIRLDDETLAERELPTRLLLDQAAPDRPLILYRYCGHIAVTNTAGLAVAGISPDTPDPAGGAFDRDERGQPTGVLRETAISAVSSAIGDRAAGLTPAQVAEASRLLAAMGLTGLGGIVAYGTSLLCDGSNELQLMLDAAPELAIPVSVLVATEAPDELSDAADRVSSAGRRLRFHGVKLFADGSLGGHTAALRTPYADRPDNLGTHRLPMETALPVAQRSLDLGGSVAIHAIGDAAVGHVLDLFERLLDAGAVPERLRMEHVSLIADDDLDRMASMGITASVQPAFLASESDWLPKRVGRQRLAYVYRFRSMARAGIPLAGGSDCPVEPPHPLHGIAAAIDRHGIGPDEAVTVDQALEMFTTGAAAAMGFPPPLSEGAPANLAILDGDPASMGPSDIRRAHLLATFIDGKSPALPADQLDWPG